MTKKRILSGLFAVLFISSATACSKANETDTNAVYAAVDRFCDCSSFSVVQTTLSDEVLVADGQEYTYYGENIMELELITAPTTQIKTAVTTKVEFDGELVEAATVSYILPENGGYAEYYNDGSQWIKVTTDDADALSAYGPSSVAATFVIDGISFFKAAEEELEGMKTTRYDGDLKSEALVYMLQSNGLLNGIASMSENQQKQILDNLVKDLGAATVSVWLDEASGYPVRFEVSLTDVLKDMEKSIAKTLGNKDTDEQLRISKYVISMTVSGFDAIEEFVLPAEAASAQLYAAA